MVRTERRQAPRMTVKELAYVNLEPNNGGIILDISEGGLCFQSPAPVQRTETIRLWFSYRSQRIEAEKGMEWKDGLQTRGVSRFIEVGGELAWIDQARKRGGVRFKHLPTEAREQIRDWMRQAEPVVIKAKSASSILPSGKSPFLSLNRWITNAARSSSARLTVLFRDLQLARLRTGFSSGLVTGVSVSTLVVAVFFLLSHTRELGNSLIQFGEGLGGRSRSRFISPSPQASSQDPQSTAPRLQPLSPQAEPVAAMPPTVPPTVAPRSLRTPLQEELPSPAMGTITKHDGEKIEPTSSPTNPLPATRLQASAFPTSRPTTGGLTTSSPTAPSGVGIIAPASDSSASVVRNAAPETESTIRPGAHMETSNVEESKAEGVGIHADRYLEAGKFKEKLWADKATGQLAQLGFPATVVQKSQWRGKSYQVLVGPYTSETAAEAAHKHLASLGFTIRSLERGTRDFHLPAALKVGGTHLPAGECVISWESYIPDAVVKIEDDRGMSVIVEGKWVKQAAPYDRNAIVYQKNVDGSRNLVEIRFSGMRQALVFGRGSS